MAKLVSVVIVNWNTRDLLLECIGSIEQGAAGVEHEIVVFDNASTDGSVEAVRNRYPNVRIIAGDKNLGFAGGNNLGVREARGDLLLILNPDTTLGDGAIRAMTDFLAEHEDVGIVGPLLVGTDGNAQISSFGIFPSVREAFIRATHLWTLSPGNRILRGFLCAPGDGETWCYSGHLLGACMLVRRDVWDRLDGMDVDYFLFLEETDFCCRAAKLGWRCAFTRTSLVNHLGEGSLRDIVEQSGGLYIRSYRRFCRKHGIGIGGRLLIDALLITGVVLQAVDALVRKRDARRSVQVLRGLVFGYFKKPGIHK